MIRQQDLENANAAMTSMPTFGTAHHAAALEFDCCTATQTAFEV